MQNSKTAECKSYMSVGRTAIGYPWIFNEIKHYMKTGEMLAPPTVTNRVEVCRQHLTKSIEWKGDWVGIVEMRRHYSQYFKGLEHFKEYRTKLVTSNSKDEILATLEEVI
jgi:tRNA-dihydrouridine synthase B